MPRQQKIHDTAYFSKAVQEVQNGCSAYKVSKKYGIPQSTLKDHARGHYMGYSTSFGREKILSLKEENALVTYLLYMSERGYPLTKKMTRNLALEVIRESGRPTIVNMNKGPSEKWLKKFFKRHPELSVRRSHGLDKGRASVTPEQLQQYFSLLSDTLKRLGIENDPTRIFNCDETGFSGSLARADKNVIVRKGVRQAFRVQMALSGHVTVNFAISASGQTLPPMVIFSKNLPRSSYSDGLPDDWEFESTESGFINSELFLKWFKNVFLTSCGKKRPCLLIMDNLLAHMSGKVIDLAQENNIDLLFFPSHTSHLLQPLDVGYFHVLKEKVSELATGLGYATSCTLPRHIFPKILHQAMNRITPATVAASFSAAGIFPFNSTVVKPLAGPVAGKEADLSSSVNVTAPEANSANNEQQNPTNMLVKIGMIPQSLANIFVEPPMLKTSSKRKGTYDKARVIKSKPLSTPQTSGPVEPSPVSEVILPSDPLSDGGVCEICMTSSALYWVGCDRCDAWYHYECLPSCEQTDVDMSLICKTEWLCNTCRFSEE